MLPRSPEHGALFVTHTIKGMRRIEQHRDRPKGKSGLNRKSSEGRFPGNSILCNRWIKNEHPACNHMYRASFQSPNDEPKQMR